MTCGFEAYARVAYTILYIVSPVTNCPGTTHMLTIQSFCRRSVKRKFSVVLLPSPATPRLLLAFRRRVLLHTDGTAGQRSVSIRQLLRARVTNGPQHILRLLGLRKFQHFSSFVAPFPAAFPLRLPPGAPIGQIPELTGR
jgi:hypothetical protein